MDKSVSYNNSFGNCGFRVAAGFLWKFWEVDCPDCILESGEGFVEPVFCRTYILSTRTPAASNIT